MLKATLGGLALTLVGSSALAQETDKEKDGVKLELPAFRQLTISGLYGENRLVKAGGSPLLGVTYTQFDNASIRVGLETEKKDVPKRLHLPNGGWYADVVTGSRAGTTVNSLGLGVAVRLTSTPLDGSPARRDRLYYGAGLGLYATRVEAARKTTGVGVGLRLFGGWDRPDGTVVEWGYAYRPGTQGVHPSGISLGVGRRF